MADVVKKNRFEIARERRAAVLYMTRAGLSVIEIARALRISQQAVYMHLENLRRDGEIPSGVGAA